MKKQLPLLILSVIALAISACSTGYSTYKHGDYYKACMEAIERLRSRPGNDKAQFVLSKSYPLAKKTAEHEIENAKIANNADMYDAMVYQYERINALAQAIYACPKALEMIPQPTEYIAELSAAKQGAAEQAYQMGIKAIEANTLEQARVAFQYFNKSNEYVNGYKDVLTKIEQARYYATLRVVVQKPFTSNRYQYSADFFFKNLLSEMSQVTRNRFVRFYSPEEAAAENMTNPHQYIVLNFEDFSIGDVRETSNSTDMKRDSVVVGTVKVNGKTYNSYNTVKAKFISIRREISSSGTLSLRIIDAANNRDLQFRNFSGSYVWYTTWGTFTGDDRALTDQQKRQCEQRPQNLPVNQDLFVEFTKPIYNQTISYVKSAYSKY